MKTTLFWVLRYLVIPVAFIWSLGIFNVSWKTDNKFEIYNFDSADYKTLEICPNNAISYSDSILRKRKELIAKGENYEPYLYFRDLKQFEMFNIVYHDFLDKTDSGRCIVLRFSCGIGGTGAITNLRDDNWRNLSFENRKTDGNTFNKMNITEARAFWFANQEKQLLANRIESEKFFWPTVWNWLFVSYFRGMLVAFILFLIWIKRFKKDCEDVYWRYENLKQPKNEFSLLSFIYALLMWPIILIQDIRNRGKETLKKADVLSRRKNMFSIFSKEEERLLKLGRKMTLRQFRNHLNEQGLVRKHSLLVALCILPILTFSFHTKSHENYHAQKKVTVYSKHYIDNDVGKEKISTFSIDIYLPQEDISILLLIKQKVIFFNYIFRLSDGFLQKPRGVPKCCLFTL